MFSFEVPLPLSVTTIVTLVATFPADFDGATESDSQPG